MLVGRTGLSPVMVGRTTELDRLTGLVGLHSAPQIALVAGEPGIGKTRLLQEFAKQIAGSTQVLTGQADPDTASHPLALYTDALNGSAGSNADATDLAATVRNEDRSADERIAAAVELMRQLTNGRSSVVIFEDVHWADPESLSVFERLASPDNTSPLLLIGTYRPEGLSRRHPASELLPRLERRHTVTHLHLQRLDAADVGQFLEAIYTDPPSFRTVTKLHTRTGGNPFFLEELVAATPDVPTCDIDETPLPWSVSELVKAQLDELDPEVRRIVTAAAELGRRVPFDVLAAVTKASEDELIELLRKAMDEGVLLETDPDVFGFHHEIAREAIASTMLGRERRRLHEAALNALRDAGSQDHASLARHALGAFRLDDMVSEARLGATSALNHGSSYQALQLAEMGLDEAPDDMPLLYVAAKAAWLLGILDEADEYTTRWLRLARQRDDVSEEARALGRSTRVAYDRGDLKAMEALTNDLIGLIDRIPTDQLRAGAMTAVAQSHMLRERIEAAIEWSDKAYELANANGFEVVKLQALIEKGSAMITDSATDKEGEALLKTAIDDAIQAGEHYLATRALNNLFWHALGWEDTDEVRRLIEQHRNQAKAAGWLTGFNEEAISRVAAVEGDLDTAIAVLDTEEITTANRAELKKGRWRAVVRAGLSLEAGDLGAAERFAAEAKPTTPRTAPGVLGLDFHLACRRGDVDAARRILPELIAAIEADGCGSASQAHDLLAAALSAGLSSDEMRPLVDLVGFYVGHRLPADNPWRQLHLAQLADADAEMAQAADLYMAAAESFGESVPVIAGIRGTVHVGAARSLIALGRLDEARTHAQAAAGYLAKWRGWRVNELRSVERRLGLGDEPTGPESLTPREREVAALVAEGLTNSQLAERIYISPRTAAVHVSNILAKLGMSSRTEVAAWVASGGLQNA